MIKTDSQRTSLTQTLLSPSHVPMANTWGDADRLTFDTVLSVRERALLGPAPTSPVSRLQRTAMLSEAIFQSSERIARRRRTCWRMM